MAKKKQYANISDIPFDEVCENFVEYHKKRYKMSNMNYLKKSLFISKELYILKVADKRGIYWNKRYELYCASTRKPYYENSSSMNSTFFRLCYYPKIAEIWAKNLFCENNTGEKTLSEDGKKRLEELEQKHCNRIQIIGRMLSIVALIISTVTLVLSIIT